jgi:hypothetical protein
MAKSKRNPGDVDLGDGIYGPKPLNAYGKVGRDLSASELSRLVENELRAQAIIANQYMTLNPGKQVNYDNSSGKTVVTDKNGVRIKAMLPSKFNAIVKGRKNARNK